MARTPGADTVYELAEAFRQRCLIRDAALLWPNDTIWTHENLSELVRISFDRDEPNLPDDLRYWDDVTRTLSPPLRKLGADLALLYQLFPSKSADTKFGDVGWMLEGDPSLEPDRDVWSVFQEAAHHGLGAGGRWYLSGGQQWSVLFYVRFAQEAKSREIDLYDRATVQTLSDDVERSLRYNTVSARNMLLHLLFPDDYEPISKTNHKENIRDAFCNTMGIEASDDLDADIRKIRHAIQSKRGTSDFGFYDGDLRDIWNNWDKRPRKEELPQDPVKTLVRGYPNGQERLPLSTLEKETFLNGTFLSEIDELLSSKHQLIFEGPPGSGKTFVAEKFARWFTGQPVDGDTPLDKHVEIVQFHQSYGYEDFVQGIRPTTVDGTLIYEIRDGIFLDMVARAEANPEDRFVLIIDEINRGNLSRVFGELLLLLEYRGQSVRLPYGVGDAAYLTIPENLYIIGTMNTADRSLAQIDYALRHRFYFVRFMPVENGRAEVFENWLAHNVDNAAARTRLAGMFIALNDGIRYHLNTDDLQVGHSYFMQPGIESDLVFERVWRRAVRPLLEEYLHHHRERDDILKALTPERLMPTGTANGADALAAMTATDAVDPDDV